MVSGLALDVAGRRVLLTGSGAHLIAQAHRLLAAGARVEVLDAGASAGTGGVSGESGGPSTSVADLAQRGLLTLVSAPNYPAYDVVLSCLDAPAMPACPDAFDSSAASLITSSAGSSTGGRRDGADRREPAAPGEVVLVGGGPGDPGLLTVAGMAALRAADVIVYDRLAPLAALAETRPDAVLIDVGKIPRGEFTPQGRINAVLLEHAGAGRRVVRFKGGDSFVFGRGGEEALACADAGIPVRVVPGVSSSIAAPGLAGIPVTHRTLTQGVTVVSGHVPPGDPRSQVDWAAVAACGTTIVVLMGVACLPQITAALIKGGLSESTPAASIADAGLASMRVVRANLSVLAEAAAQAGLGAPCVTVIGDVAALDVLAGSGAQSSQGRAARPLAVRHT